MASLHVMKKFIIFTNHVAEKHAQDSISMPSNQSPNINENSKERLILKKFDISIRSHNFFHLRVSILKSQFDIIITF
jgi:hypothetical protein